MFGLGVPELIFILLLALLIFGPKKLPEIGRTLGKGMSEFRKASNELTRSINAELSLDEEPAPPQVRRMAAVPPPATEVRSASPLIAAVPAPAPPAASAAETEAQAAEPVRTEAPAPPIEPS
jgi:sec-independent protein translocase protein TatA